MRRLALPLLALLALSAGCAAAPLTPESAADADAAPPASVDEVAAAEEPAAEDAPASGDRRRVGDFVKWSFSGRYRKAPLELTQRVVARTADTISVELTFEEKGERDTLRVTTGTSGELSGRTIEVVEVLDGGATRPVSQEAYESRMMATAPSTDVNEGLLDERQVKVRVGGEEVEATTSVFQIRIGKQVGKLETTVSDAFAWGDLGGKITLADGKVYFAAELVDAGGPAGATASLELR